MASISQKVTRDRRNFVNVGPTQSTSRPPDQGQLQPDAPVNPSALIRTVWNTSFLTVLSTRDTNFQLISSKSDLGFYIASGNKEKRKKHLIFSSCSKMVLLLAAKHFSTETTFDFDIHSLAFVNCTFGEKVDSDILLKSFISITTLKALSIVKCDISEDILINNNPQPQPEEVAGHILRVEITMPCDKLGLIGLLNLLSCLSALSLTSICTCSSKIAEFGCQNLAVGSPNSQKILRTVESKVKSLTELEFDMNILNLKELTNLFMALGAEGKLTTLVFNRSDFNSRDEKAVHWEFLNLIKNSLKYIEIKDESYLLHDVRPGTAKNEKKVSNSVSIFDLLMNSGCEVLNLTLRWLKPKIFDGSKSAKTSQYHHLYLKDQLEAFPRLQSVVIEDCDIQDIKEALQDRFPFGFNSQQPEKFKPKFRYFRNPYYITNLELIGIGDLFWDFLSVLSAQAPQLEKLDLTRFTRWAQSSVENRQPMDFIFMRMERLKVLILDGLEIGDDALFGKLTYGRESEKGVEEPHISLGCLQALEKLSIQNTEITNVSMKCIALYLPNLTRLNVSYTKANEQGCEYARNVNRKLEIEAVGCGIPRSKLVEYQNPRLI